jgi:hypothetical protein
MKRQIELITTTALIAIGACGIAQASWYEAFENDVKTNPTAYGVAPVPVATVVPPATEENPVSKKAPAPTPTKLRVLPIAPQQQNPVPQAPQTPRAQQPLPSPRPATPAPKANPGASTVVPATPTMPDVQSINNMRATLRRTPTLEKQDNQQAQTEAQKTRNAILKKTPGNARAAGGGTADNLVPGQQPVISQAPAAPKETVVPVQKTFTRTATTTTSTVTQPTPQTPPAAPQAPAVPKITVVPGQNVFGTNTTTTSTVTQPAPQTPAAPQTPPAAPPAPRTPAVTPQVVNTTSTKSLAEQLKDKNLSPAKTQPAANSTNTLVDAIKVRLSKMRPATQGEDQNPDEGTW